MLSEMLYIQFHIRTIKDFMCADKGFERWFRGLSLWEVGEAKNAAGEATEGQVGTSANTI